MNPTEKIIERYLEALGVSLWPGVAFDITDPKERARAAAWFAAEVAAYDEAAYHAERALADRLAEALWDVADRGQNSWWPGQPACTALAAYDEARNGG